MEILVTNPKLNKWRYAIGFLKTRDLFEKRLAAIYQLSEKLKKTCLDMRSLLFLCNMELHKKFSPVLTVCERWCHSEKKITKTGITFHLDMILDWVLLEVIFFEGISVEKLKLHAFYGIQYRFKDKLRKLFEKMRRLNDKTKH